MKTILLSLVIIGLALCAMPAVAAPYSVDLTMNNTNATADFVMPMAVQPLNLHVYGVLPNTTTTTISRVHGTYVQTLATVTVAAGVGTATLTNGLWLVPGDKLRVAGPTNATVEVQGNQ